MADIHLLPENGDPVVYSEEHIAELLAAGRLSPATLYWRKGMADWQPLASFQRPVRTSARRTEPVPISALNGANAAGRSRSQPASQRIAPEPRPVGAPHTTSAPSPSRAKPPGRPRYRFRRNPWPLTILVELLLLACLVITLLEMENGAGELQKVASAKPAIGYLQALSDSWNAPLHTPFNVSPAEAKAALSDQMTFDTGDVLEWSGWAANVLLLVPFFMWLHRTTVNCRHLSSILRLKPASVVGDYFIPFVNLFRPCQSMQELWRVSRNPRSWLNDRGSVLVGLWWVLTLLVIGGSIESSALFSGSQTRSDEVVARLFFVVLKGIQAGWYVSFLALVALIMRNQARVVAQSRQRSGSGR